jgi:hypothetical protein
MSEAPATLAATGRKVVARVVDLTKVCRVALENAVSIAGMLLSTEERDLLGSLEVGQAIVKLQGRIQRPFLISIPEFRIEKGRVTDEQIREYMKDKVSQFGIENAVSDDVAGAEEGPGEDGGGNSLTSMEIAFLRDVEDNPDSGVAARYKRLGLSGRQGQKLKTKLLEQGLIEEQLGTTPAGRLMTIRLSGQGTQLLSKAKE